MDNTKLNVRLVILIISVCINLKIFAQINWQKSTENPVIVANMQNGVFGYSDPTLFFDGHDYQLWITGGGFIDNDTTAGVRIYYFTSEDGISWQPATENPVLREAPPGSWDSGHIETPHIISVDDEYRLYYAATVDSTPDDPATLQIGVTTSPDGIEWQRHPENPLLQRGNPGEWDERWIESPCVVRSDSLCYMYYNGFDAAWRVHIGLAISTDGIHWEKYSQNPVFSPAVVSDWDSVGVYAPQVRKIGSTWWMLYTGIVFNETGYDFENTHTGVARSDDGIHWTRASDQPVLNGESDAWDHTGPFTLDWIVANNHLYMLYVSDGLAGVAVSTIETNMSAHSEFQSSQFTLLQNYPNPFNNETVIPYQIRQPSAVNIDIYNIRGEKVKSFYNRHSTSGFFQINWNGANENGAEVATGVYLAQLNVGFRFQTVKMIVLR